MRRFPTSLLLLAAVLVAACAPDAQPSLHDVYVYGHEGRDVRYSYFYGNPTTFALEGRTVTLEDGSSDDPLAVSGALLVDGEPYLSAPVDAIPAPVDVARIPLTTDLQVRTSAPVTELVYFDGSAWLTLLRDAGAGLDRRVAAKLRIGRLRGVGELTAAEADALSDWLAQAGRPLVVAALPEDALPDRSLDGLSEYLATGLYVQDTVAVDPTTFRPPAQDVVWDVIAQGSQALGFDSPTFRLVDSESEFLSLWNRAHGTQLEVPPLPAVDFTRATVLAIFQGQRSTGGYGIEVLDVSLDGGDLFVDMRFVEPAPDAIVTQALTSPWVMVQVPRGGIGVAWFRNPATGELLGVARDVE